ncbi:MAG: hypothetical protein CVV56_03385 [Tenericutes bacterium HGW-Tenericutes-1]|jgi:site-specific DNA-methyltransferase (adenine-specific)|nr:MAG: hypothetical protein CVV56_03385 [Tenericutes bacterium HGW-Tenericutes-1]
MINQKHIEIIFEYIDSSAVIFFEELKLGYLDGITEAVNNLLSDSVDESITSESSSKIKVLLDNVKSIDFKKEEVRKAMQLCILKGFKHQKRTNADITPDTIGIFMAFLVEKLYPKAKELLIFDPLVGTGNLITTVANQLKIPTQLIGVESNIESYHLANAMFDMMDYGDELYFQDTLLFYNLRADVIVTDFPYSTLENGSYFPYDAINHHYNNLLEGGYLLAVIPNDFFEVPSSELFKDVIKDLWQVVGLVKLPDSIFKTVGKSIFILQKNGENVRKLEKALLADITSFEDEDVLQIQIAKINQWFKANFDKIEEKQK